MAPVRRILVLLSVTLVLATLMIVPGFAVGATLPQTCAEVRQQNPAATDGEYTLVLQGRTAHIYCADMDGTPKEYISLTRTLGSYNYSHYYGNHKNHYYQYWWVYGTDALTHYTKIRIDPVTLVVDQNDQKFAVLTSVGKNGYDSSDPNFNPVPKSMAYATAADCAASWSARGKGNVDLTGTDFAFADETTFGVGGYAANGSVSVDPGRQIVNLTGGGWCGGAGPVGQLKLKLLTPLADQTPPVTSAAAPAGWQNQDVTVTLSATDDVSGVAATYWQLDGAAQQQGTSAVISADGTHSLVYWSVDKAGNVETHKTATIQVDKTTPVISGSAGTTGWTNQPVTVTFICTDATSGVQSCQSPVTLTAEGANQSATGTAADKAGNMASATVSGINIDLTAPTVTYSGNAGTYSVDQTVSITCAAADGLSGVASDTCAPVSGPAYSLPLGENTYTAAATDKAGNTGTNSVRFTVSVSQASLCSLTRQFVANGGVADSLCAKLDNSAKQAAAGKTGPSNNLLEAYINEVGAQTGKAMTGAQADTLIQLARALLK